MRSYFLIASTTCLPTAAPSVPIPALTVIFIVEPNPAELAPDRGTTASGPASPIRAFVGPRTIPPLASLYFLVMVESSVLLIAGAPLDFSSAAAKSARAALRLRSFAMPSICPN